MARGAECRSLPVRGDRYEAAAVRTAHRRRARAGPVDEVGAWRARGGAGRAERLCRVPDRSSARSGLVPRVTAASVRPRMGRQAVQRAAVVLVAVVVVAWLAISYGDADSIDSAAYLAGRSSATPAQLEAAVKDVRSAATLNPSRAGRRRGAAPPQVWPGPPPAPPQAAGE